MDHSQMMQRLQERRSELVARLQAIPRAAVDESREMSPAEDKAYTDCLTDLESVEARIAQEQNTERGVQATRDTMARFGGHRPARSAEDKDLDRAFASALKSKHFEPIEVPIGEQRIWQPAVEQRDILKSTATQALPVSVYSQIVAAMTETCGVLRAGAVVVQSDTGEDLAVPKSTAWSTANLTSEGASITESDPTLAVTTLKAYKYAAFFQASTELLSDGSPGLTAYLAKQAGEALALAYGPHFLTGDGSSKPTGIVTTATTGVTGPTGTSTSLGVQSTAGMGTDLLIDLHASLAEPYAVQPTRAWLLRNSSLAKIRKLKDTNGQPVIAGDQSSYLGAPLIVDPNVAAMAANAKSIVYGDFSRVFVRIAGPSIRFEADDSYAFQSDLRSFRAIIRTDCALVDVNAVKLFVNSAT